VNLPALEKEREKIPWIFRYLELYVYLLILNNLNNMETTVFIKISGRKEPGYPTTSHQVTFDGDLTVFENLVDGIIDQLGYRKADVYIDNPEEFNEDEQETLETMGFIL
jgi:hypothetical protein